MIAAVLLAAGRSTRFGGDKLLASVGDRPVIRCSAEVLAAMVDELVVVVPPDDAAVRSALRGLPVRFVENVRRDDGMSSSLAAGVAALPPHCEAVLIALGDQPGIRAEVVAATIERWRGTRAPAVTPLYSDGRGHPVLFDRRCFGQLLSIVGDSGARAVLESLGSEVALVAVDGAQPADVDTRDALERLAREPRPGT